ncbi:MAG: cyclic nucleotide-binding domain-containing protein [Bauldia sp.]|nr:cyclic nucleotide-binding domain-containing protein [Bauldia sp.]
MHWFDFVGYLASLFNIASISRRSMIPLRVLAILSNGTFIAYGAAAQLYPVLITHLILLPLNVLRLREMLDMVARLKQAVSGELRLDWLKHFTGKRRVAAGEVIFHRGEPAEEMFVTLSGRFRLRELHLEFGAGEVVGELGLLSPGQLRGATLECLADGEIQTIGYDEVRQLCLQNPEFGFYFVQLTTRRLFENLSRVERDAEAQAAGASA